MGQSPDLQPGTCGTLVPLNAALELTHRCNLSCVHCFVRAGPAVELTTTEVTDAIGHLAGLGTLELTFSGGEPLLRDDFFEIASFARETHMACTLMTNGTLINEAVADRIQALGFYRVAISLYGACHDRVTGITGSLERTQRAIGLLRHRNVKVQVKTTVMSINAGEVRDLAAFCAGVGADFLPNPSLCPCTDGSREPLLYRLSDSQLRSFLRWRQEGGDSPAGFTGPCNAGRRMLAITPWGDVYPCVSMRLAAGNLRDERLAQVWMSSPVLKKIRGLRFEDFPRCARCEMLYLCEQCPGDSLAEEGVLTAAHSESCRIARIRREVISGGQDKDVHQAHAQEARAAERGHSRRQEPEQL